MESTTKRLADSIGFELLGAGLAEDVEASLSAALKAGGVFSGDPLSVFRETLTRSIREMEQTDKRVDLLQRFLRDMSYDWGAERRGESPDPVAVAHLDEELAEVVNFISGHMVNRFQGGIAELLAAAPCQALMENLQQSLAPGRGRCSCTARCRSSVRPAGERRRTQPACPRSR